MVVLQLAFTYWPPMNAVFGTAPLEPRTWLAIAVAAAASWTIVELEKAIKRRRVGQGPRPEPARSPV